VNNKKSAAYRQGLYVLIVLAVLTAVEFWVSTSFESAVVWLILIALLKTALIAQFFMHIYRLWREEEH